MEAKSTQGSEAETKCLKLARQFKAVGVLGFLVPCGRIDEKKHQSTLESDRAFIPYNPVLTRPRKTICIRYITVCSCRNALLQSKPVSRHFV